MTKQRVSAKQRIVTEAAPVSAAVSYSYDHGVSTEPLLGCTIGDFLKDMAARRGNAEAVVSCHQDVRLTYAQLKEQVDLFARGLIKLGIERGDRMGIWSTNNCEWLITQLAAATIGAILVNINPAYKTSELEYALRQSGVKLLVLIPEHRDTDYLHMLNGLAHKLFCLEDKHDLSLLPNLEHIVVIGKKTDLPGKLMPFERVMLMGNELPELQLIERMKSLQFDDPINIQYTSGTTGQPKGVTLSHHNLINNALIAARMMGLQESSRFCVPMPFYHCGGMISSSLATLSVGGTVVIPCSFFDEALVLKALEQEHCTHISGVPTMFIAQLEHADFAKFKLTSMRGGFMAGAPCPVQLMRRVANSMHMNEVVILYGLTEASPLMTATSIKDSLEVRSTTVGRAIPGIEVKVVDPLSGGIQPRGVQGEICSRGHGVMLGYWNNPSATADCIDKAGWLHSGDLGVMRDDGLINITGRKKDMIIRGGENIYPKEIEELLLDHDAIAQAQVFGVPDKTLGEAVAVWVLLKKGHRLDPPDLVAWIKERVAYFKVPRYIKMVNKFPMTETGKVQKFVMRDVMIKELGLEAAANMETA